MSEPSNIAHNATVKSPVPLLGFCAYGSGVGKTTLLSSLIPALTQRGLRISVIKHAHHTFDIDHPGKDSYRLRESGAVQVLLGSRKRWALMTELSRITPETPEPRLVEFMQHMDASLADLIVVEGFKQEPIPKIEVCRPSLNNPLLSATDPNVIAVAADGPVTSHLPVLDLNNITQISDFVSDWLETQHHSKKVVNSI